MGQYKEIDYGNDGRNNFDTLHFAAGSVADSQETLISGNRHTDFGQCSIFVQNEDGGQSSTANVQVWMSNYSGTTAASGAIATTNGWALVGSPIVVTSGNSAIKSWETTDAKFIAVTGSCDAATSGGLNVDLFRKTRT